MLKKCTTCEQPKELDEYYKAKNRCKDCFRLKNKKWRENGPDRTNPYNPRTLVMPETTVFSTNPKTGKPYATIDYATNLIYKHTSMKGKNLLSKIELEDLKQELLVRLCTSAYNPELSKPITFMLMCFNHKFGFLYESLFVVRDKHKETGDVVLSYNEEGVPLMATDLIGIEETTPEDFCLAKEFIEEFDSREGKAKYRKHPKGWKGFREESGPRKKKRPKINS